MTTPGRFAAFMLSLLLVGGVGVTNGAAPAAASITTLCTGYTACARAGMSDGGYAAASRTMWWRMYTGHNCTNYAAFRMVRSGLPNTRPWSGSGNATNWGTATTRLTDATPKVGSVAWWKAGVKPAGSAGHVAYVERVVSANEIIVSQDSWRGDFSWTRIVRTGGGWPSGFIHFNDVPVRNTGVPSISGTAQVGSVLTASAGAWSLPGVTFAYQWTENGVHIAGATGPTLTLTPALLGKPISVTVTALKPGHAPVGAGSAPTTPVEPGTLEVSGVPSVAGTPRLGRTLTVRAPTLPARATHEVQWLRAGVPVTGATGPSYRLGAADLGSSISAQVRVVRPGYTAVTMRSAPTPLVRSTPAIRLAAQPGVGRLDVTATVTAAGVPTVTGAIQVRARGKLLGVVALRDGVARTTVTGLPSGAITFRFRYVTTARVSGAMVPRRIRIG